MISQSALIAAIEPLTADALKRWLEEGFVLPRGNSDSSLFDTADVARVRLICELHYELNIEEDSLSVVLSLLDQLYAARQALRNLAAAVEAEPPEIRDRIVDRIP